MIYTIIFAILLVLALALAVISGFLSNNAIKRIFLITVCVLVFIDLLLFVFRCKSNNNYDEVSSINDLELEDVVDIVSDGNLSINEAAMSVNNKKIDAVTWLRWVGTSLDEIRNYYDSNGLDFDFESEVADDYTLSDYIIDTAETYIIRYSIINEEFSEDGLELSADDQKDINSYINDITQADYLYGITDEEHEREIYKENLEYQALSDQYVLTGSVSDDVREDYYNAEGYSACKYLITESYDFAETVLAELEKGTDQSTDKNNDEDSAMDKDSDKDSDINSDDDAGSGTESDVKSEAEEEVAIIEAFNRYMADENVTDGQEGVINSENEPYEGLSDFVNDLSLGEARIFEIPDENKYAIVMRVEDDYTKLDQQILSWEFDEELKGRITKAEVNKSKKLVNFDLENFMNQRDSIAELVYEE